MYAHDERREYRSQLNSKIANAVFIITMSLATAFMLMRLAYTAGQIDGAERCFIDAKSTACLEVVTTHTKIRRGLGTF